MLTVMAASNYELIKMPVRIKINSNRSSRDKSIKRKCLHNRASVSAIPSYRFIEFTDQIAPQNVFDNCAKRRKLKLCDF